MNWPCCWHPDALLPFIPEKAMKILWLTNMILPQIAEHEHREAPVHNGWVVNLANMISAQPELELVCVFGGSPARSGRAGAIRYHALPEKGGHRRYGADYVQAAAEILKLENPDVIHIWGTETPHTLGFTEAAEQVGMLPRVVISIQGLLSVIAKDYCGFLPHRVVHSQTLNGMVKGNIAKGLQGFIEGGKLEVEAMQRVRHLIGRTDWDRAASWAINPKARYHYNAETLRASFYAGEWSYEACEKHSLFVSQSNYPLKGAHLALEALAIVKEHYPDAKLYIGGHDITKFPFWRISPYRKYLLSLIDRLGVRENVVFTGFLKEEEMKARFLKSHVFISASSIENSPNSVGEAMLLGTPVVASCVGGLLSMLEHGKEGLLYPASEVNMLAHHICAIFADVDLARRLSRKARLRAARTHDAEANVSGLMQIYQEIAADEK